MLPKIHHTICRVPNLADQSNKQYPVENIKSVIEIFNSIVSLLAWVLAVQATRVNICRI